MKAGDRVRVAATATDLGASGRPSVHAGRAGGVAELLDNDSMTVLLDGDERPRWFLAAELEAVEAGGAGDGAA